MGALPRPDVPPGAHRDLVEALHRLHHRAGWPSLRVLGRQVGCSPSTVSAVFSSPGCRHGARWSWSWRRWAVTSRGSASCG